MFLVVCIIIIALVFIYRIYKKGNTLKQENADQASKLQKLKEERKSQYEEGRDIQNRIAKAVKDFNEQADRFSNLGLDICKFEKEYYIDIIQDKNYKNELKLYKEICDINYITKEPKFMKIFKPKQYHAKNLSKCLEKKGKKSIFIQEDDIEQDFNYKKSESRGGILFDTLIRWTVIIFGACAVIITLVSKPTILLFLLAFIIACVICLVLDDVFSLDIAIILPIIAGVLTIGIFLVTLVASLGAILSGFILFYFSVGLWATIYYSFFLYNKSVLEERNRIEMRIQNAENKINEGKQGNRNDAAEALEDLVKAIRMSLDDIDTIVQEFRKSRESEPKNDDMKKVLIEYWDWLILGNCFLNGLNRNDNGLNMEFVETFYNNLEKVLNAEWRNENENAR